MRIGYVIKARRQAAGPVVYQASYPEPPPMANAPFFDGMPTAVKEEMQRGRME